MTMFPCHIHRYSSPQEMAIASASRWLAELSRACEATHNLSIALSGGRGARLFFEAVTLQAICAPVAWDRIHFFWGDERCVPPEDRESNFGLAQTFLFDPLSIPAKQVHRIRGECPAPQAATEAEAEARQYLLPDAAGRLVFDWVLLGMGEDGHVASLFPGESDAITQNPAMYRAVIGPKPPPQRTTLGYPSLWAARSVWVLTSGAGKEAALRDSLSPSGQTPLARVIRGRQNTDLFTDIP